MTGLIETVQVRGGRPIALPRHQRRFARSWPSFLPGAAPSLGPLVEEALADASLDPCMVRVECVPGTATSGTGIVVAIRPCLAVPDVLEVAMSPKPTPVDPALRCHKVTARDWMQAHAVDGVFDTLLWCERSGLLEGTITNLFVERDGAWFTPRHQDGLVPGVVREAVLEIAVQQNLPIRENRVDSELIAGASGLFLSNSGVGLVPVDRLDGTALRSKDSPLLQHLRRLLPWNEGGISSADGRDPSGERQ